MGERFKFNKYHIDSTWKEEFSEDALLFLCQNKEWMYDKINYAVNGISKNDGKQEANEGMDWIIVVDSGEVETAENAEGDKNKLNVKVVTIASDHAWYSGYDNMFFKSMSLKQGAVANLQSENEVLKEVASAIVKGAGAVYDSSILFPFTRKCWKDLSKKDEEVATKKVDEETLPYFGEPSVNSKKASKTKNTTGLGKFFGKTGSF